MCNGYNSPPPAPPPQPWPWRLSADKKQDVLKVDEPQSGSDGSDLRPSWAIPPEWRKCVQQASPELASPQPRPEGWRRNARCFSSSPEVHNFTSLRCPPPPSPPPGERHISEIVSPAQSGVGTHDKSTYCINISPTHNNFTFPEAQPPSPSASLPVSPSLSMGYECGAQEDVIIEPRNGAYDLGRGQPYRQHQQQQQTLAVAPFFGEGDYDCSGGYDDADVEVCCSQYNSRGVVCCASGVFFVCLASPSLQQQPTTTNLCFSQKQMDAQKLCRWCIFIIIIMHGTE